MSTFRRRNMSVIDLRLFTDVKADK